MIVPSCCFAGKYLRSHHIKGINIKVIPLFLVIYYGAMLCFIQSPFLTEKKIGNAVPMRSHHETDPCFIVAVASYTTL